MSFGAQEEGSVSHLGQPPLKGPIPILKLLHLAPVLRPERFYFFRLLI